jgi:hypothetical protein
VFAPVAPLVKEFKLPMIAGGDGEEKGLCALGDIKEAYGPRIWKVGSLYA